MIAIDDVWLWVGLWIMDSGEEGRERRVRRVRRVGGGGGGGRDPH